MKNISNNCGPKNLGTIFFTQIPYDVFRTNRFGLETTSTDSQTLRCMFLSRLYRGYSESFRHTSRDSHSLIASNCMRTSPRCNCELQTVQGTNTVFKAFKKENKTANYISNLTRCEKIQNRTSAHREANFFFSSGFREAIFSRGFLFFVTHDGLSERGTTCSLPF